MNLSREIAILLRKDFELEIKKKQVALGLLVYMSSCIFLVQILEENLNARMWNVVFWLLMVFVTMTIVNKSFLGESKARQLFYYNNFRAQAMIISKQIYSLIISIVFGMIAYLLFSFFIPLEIDHRGQYFVILLLGTVSISLSTTFLSSISAQVMDSSGALTAVLGMPLLIPLFLLIQQSSIGFVSSVVGVDFLTSVVLLLVFDVIIFFLSLLLFPLVWTK